MVFIGCKSLQSYYLDDMRYTKQSIRYGQKHVISFLYNKILSSLCPTFLTIYRVRYYGLKLERKKKKKLARLHVFCRCDVCIAFLHAIKGLYRDHMDGFCPCLLPVSYVV